MATPFTEAIVEMVRAIPVGTVATYGQIASAAGNPRGARTVVWVLRSLSQSEKLPWHRVLNAQGRVALGRGQGFELQCSLLRDEGIEVASDGSVDLTRYRMRER